MTDRWYVLRVAFLANTLLGNSIFKQYDVLCKEARGKASQID